jgi:hypothetical protein
LEVVEAICEANLEARTRVAAIVTGWMEGGGVFWRGVGMDEKADEKIGKLGRDFGHS